ncbi:Ubiquinone/menaquinone biosynthesis C-methylase UbiE [Nakamurella panacisegetis]|uniref:Ubiquinone/menaquinone biosynthesis C-methylase UbiE n=1 Tax=Nakamurella panacisegetis TaxID=1090615 RepID=A0A1H0MGQ7_9ACTN|nr:class I SAM-dependent methyltransferase [Nakamurella panacisegetis]SDO79505.1 Ubiquinone/menaquinone biosynthesis C-methylase UbiE [Nakamurella panacisegetis]
MHLDQHYVDPRVAAIYDTANAARQDFDFYLALARELNARHIIDLACGTGALAVELAAQGATVTGVDPAPAMLDVARRRPGADQVRWLDGDSSALPAATADLVVMTGHAAQVFLTDEQWRTVLADCARALRPGGVLAFETRNPSARGWRAWNRTDSHRAHDGPEAFETWVEITDVRPDFVSFTGHTVFTADGRVVLSPSTLRFRTSAQVRTSLADAGFAVRQVFGDWTREAVTDTAPELIFVAERT